MTSKYILFLFDPKRLLAQLWKNVASKHPMIQGIISNNVHDILNHTNFDQISVIAYSSFSVPLESFAQICQRLPNLQWIHFWSAGIDRAGQFLKTLPSTVIITNSKGAYSSILAEYAMAAILHFDKQIPRLIENRKNKNYERFRMSRLEGKTLGILGYGDIGMNDDGRIP